MRRFLPLLLLVAQTALLAVELFTHYDTTQRQIALAVTNVASIALFLWVRAWLKTKGIAFPWTVLAFIVVAVWLDALGNFQHFYARFWWWDRVAHAVGLLPATVAFVLVLELLASRDRIRLPVWARMVFALALANTLGALYEISEWLGDVWFHTNRVQSAFDTPRDLFHNLIGSVVVILGAVLARRLTKKPQAGRVPQ